MPDHGAIPSNRMHHSHRFAPLVGVLFVSFAPAQQWTPVAPTASPAARNSHGMSYDVARGVAVTFGGYDGNATIALGDTWAFDGANWTPRTPATAPDARWGHGMAFDSRRARTVLFGGFRPGVGSVADMWEFDGTSWTQVTTANAPAGRAYHAMAFDSVRNRMVVFGGLGNALATLGDTWSFDGVDWTQVTTPITPSPRRGAAIAFDAARGMSVLFGGGDGTTNFNDTWTFDGSAWTQRTTTAAPSARWQAAATFDSVRGQIVLHGGADVAYATNYGDTWEWNDTNWAQTTTGGPSARHGAGLVYDGRRGAAVMFGGRAAGFGGDTWELRSRPSGRALRLGADMRIEFPFHPIMHTGNGAATIEYWVRADSPRGLTDWARYNPGREHKNLSVRSDGAIGHIYAWAQWPDVFTAPGVVAADGQWHHVAVVRHDNGSWFMFANGIQVYSHGATTGVIEGSGPTWIECQSTPTNLPGWDIDCLRVSRIARYTGNFSPAVVPATDAFTVMLVQFDEGFGTTVHDAGPGLQTGTIVPVLPGATPSYTWVDGLGGTQATATFTTYGTSCDTTFGAPQLTTAPNSTPRLGQTLQLRLSNLPTNSSQLPFGFFATHNESAIGLPLPFSMARYGMNADCLQYIDPDSGLMFTLVNNAGSADWDLGIPNDPALLQLAVFFQGLVLDWNLTTSFPAASTNAGVATIGH